MPEFLFPVHHIGQQPSAVCFINCIVLYPHKLDAGAEWFSGWFSGWTCFAWRVVVLAGFTASSNLPGAPGQFGDTAERRWGGSGTRGFSAILHSITPVRGETQPVFSVAWRWYKPGILKTFVFFSRPNDKERLCGGLCNIKKSESEWDLLCFQIIFKFFSSITLKWFRCCQVVRSIKAPLMTFSGRQRSWPKTYKFGFREKYKQLSLLE